MKLLRSAVLVAAATVALIPTAAQANTYRHTDASGDVVAFTGNSTTQAPQPDRANGDVISSIVKHKARAIIAQMAYRDLANVDGVYNAHVFVIKTSKMRRIVTVVTASGIPPQVMMTKPNGKKVSCNVKRAVDYTAKTVTVKVPRRCVDNPRWVKVGMASVFMTGIGSTDTQYVDDALRSGDVASTGPVFSPKVFR